MQLNYSLGVRKSSFKRCFKNIYSSSSSSHKSNLIPDASTPSSTSSNLLEKGAG